MDCRRARKALMEYVDSGLPDGVAAEVRSHLEDCPGCSSAADRLSLSRSALGSLERVAMPAEASRRVMEELKTESGNSRRASGFLRSPRTIATAGLVTAVLVAAAIIVGLYTSRGPSGRQSLTEKSAPAESKPVSAPGREERQDSGAGPGPSGGPMVMPVAAVTANNYDKDSIESMAKNLEVKKKFAERYTLADAVTLRVLFCQKLADDFVAAGGDGPTLEAMISFASGSEPTLLPCYAEKALFSGQPVIIIGLSGPPRNGATRSLTRTEFWAFSTEKFVADPSVSIVWWGQSQE